MESAVVALFGEAEKGAFKTPTVCRTVPQLLELFGHPPRHSDGIFFAIQALMYHHLLLFLRVHEEGFSQDDYFAGLNLLRKSAIVPQISALCLPGVGDEEIIQAILPVCAVHHSIVIMSEADLYDYLTN